MSAWRRSVSGSASSSSRSASGPAGRRGRAPAPAPRTEPADPARHRSGGQALDDEVDRVADGRDPRRLLARHRDPVGVLELHHAARRGRASRRRGPPGTGSRRAISPASSSSSVARCSRTFSITSSRLSAHSSSFLSRIAPSGRARALAAARPSARPPALDRAGGEPDRVRDPLGARAAVADDGDAAQAEQDRAAGRVGVHLAPQAAERRAQQQAADRGRPGSSARRRRPRRRPCARCPRSSSARRCR